MQVGRSYAGRIRDDVDFRLGAPVSANMGDCAPDDVVVRRRG